MSGADRHGGPRGGARVDRPGPAEVRAGRPGDWRRPDGPSVGTEADAAPTVTAAGRLRRTPSSRRRPTSHRPRRPRCGPRSRPRTGATAGSGAGAPSGADRPRRRRRPRRPPLTRSRTPIEPASATTCRPDRRTTPTPAGASGRTSHHEQLAARAAPAPLGLSRSAGSGAGDVARDAGGPPRRCGRRGRGRTPRSSRGGTPGRRAARGAPRLRLERGRVHRVDRVGAGALKAMWSSRVSGPP